MSLKINKSVLFYKTKLYNSCAQVNKYKMIKT